jgi:phosphate transport system permease protein
LRFLVDRSVKYLMLACALASVLVLLLIGLFILREGLPAFREVGVRQLLLGRVWRPKEGQLGLWPMISGSVLVTVGAIALGVPVSLGAAIFLAEVAPSSVREVVRPAIELLAGIPSVIYGLFGMIVLVPWVRNTFRVPGNTGYGLLSASIVLAVMILPTVTSVGEDAIRSVHREHKEGSLALGATHWQTIVGVILPAARSGITAGVILGVGRALGETMAMIMVIGNSVVVPSPMSPNPLTLFLRQARTLTGNIAVEISYATGLQEQALFATGVVLFALIMVVNSAARALLKGRPA